MEFNFKILSHCFLKHYKDYIGEFGQNSQKLSELLDDDNLAQGFRKIQAKTHIGAGMGNASGEIGTMQEDAIRSSHTAPAIRDGIVMGQVFRLHLLAAEVR
jgi:hypothetical protein